MVDALFDALQGALGVSLAGGALGGRAVALRWSLHRHSGQGFQGSVSRDLDLEAGAELRSSGTLWRALSDRPEACALDVEYQELHWADGGSAPLTEGALSEGTLTGLRQIRASHLIALPLPASGRALAGMVVLELAAPHAAGRPPGLADLPAWQVLVDTAALALDARHGPPPSAPRAGEGRWAELLRTADLLAVERAPVVVLGGAGMGRTWIAERLHQRSGAGRLHAARAADLSSGALEAALSGGGTLLIEDLPALSAACQRRLEAALAESGPGPRLLFTSEVAPSRLRELGDLRPRLARSLELWVLELPTYAAIRPELPEIAAGMLTELGEGVAPRALSPGAAARLATADPPSRLRELREVLRIAWHLAGRSRAEGEERAAALSVESLDQALARWRQTETVLDQLRPAARVLVEAARQRPLNLRQIEGFAGLVLVEALRDGLDAEAAARLFALGHQVEDGNHWKTLRAVRDRLEALCGALGEPVPEILQRELAPRWRRGG